MPRTLRLVLLLAALLLASLLAQPTAAQESATRAPIGDADLERQTLPAQTFSEAEIFGPPVTIDAQATRAAAAQRGPTIAVTTVDDETSNPATCSLREAIGSANSGSALGGCLFSGDASGVFNIFLPSGRYALSNSGRGDDANLSGDLDVAVAITIDGQGTRNTFIDGLRADRIFHILPGGNLTLTNMTLENARTTDGAFGGAVLNNGTLTIRNSLLRNNVAAGAGGAIESTGLLTLEMTNLFNNIANINGGALHVSGSATTTSTGGNVLNNTALVEGGGYWNGSGNMTVDGTRFTGNRANGVAADNGGGGLFNAGGNLTLSNALVSFNGATGSAGSGGGVFNDQGTLTISRSMLRSNFARRAGGGVEANIGSTTLNDVDFAENATGSAPGNGGAVHVTGAGTLNASGGRVNNNLATAEGGGFWNGSGTMTVDGTVFIENIAAGAAADNGGGGLFNAGGTLIVRNATLRMNQASGQLGSGGGIFNDQGTLRVSDSTLTRNVALRAGGGLEANLGTTELTNVDFVGNLAGNTPGNGGAVHVTGAGNLTATGGNVVGNSAVAEGGGFWNGSGMMSVDGTTFRNNAGNGTGSDQGGGALFNAGGTLEVRNATILLNRAPGSSGGGILNDQGALIVSNTLIDRNTATRAGGGIEANLGTTTLTDVMLLRNRTGSTPGNGGGLHVTGAGNATLSGGAAVGNSAAAEGGGVWNGSGTMTIRNMRIAHNIASGSAADQGGGGLFNAGGTLIVSDAMIVRNSANGSSGSGGGLLNDRGNVTLTDVSFDRNVAVRAGGAVEDNAGTQLWTRVNARSNSTGAVGAVAANPGNGGALHITGLGNVTIIDSAIVRNSAAAEGGGLWNFAGATLNVSGSTLTENSANGTAVDSSGGGGIFNLGLLTVRNTSLIRNSSQLLGGGLYNNAAAAESDLDSVRFVDNNAGNGSAVANDGVRVTAVNSAVINPQPTSCFGPIQGDLDGCVTLP